jgi:hypothetical protein
LPVEADQGQIEQVHLNLYLNACRRCPRAGSCPWGRGTPSSRAAEAEGPFRGAGEIRGAPLSPTGCR